MKSAVFSFIFVCALLCSNAAQAQSPPQIELRGIINVTGQQAALLQLDGEAWLVKAGDHFRAGKRDQHFDVQVLELDLTNEIVQTRIAGENFTNNLPANHSAQASGWIHLRNADFKDAMDLCAVSVGRTILLHPELSDAPFSCEASWTNTTPAKAELIDCFAKTLRQRGIVMLEDGDSFLQIVPENAVRSAVLRAKDLPTAKTNTIAPGLIDFEAVEMEQVLEIYGKLIGRTRAQPQSWVNGRVWFKTTSPLTKAEVIYAFETIFRWHGINITLPDDHSFRVSQ